MADVWGGVEAGGTKFNLIVGTGPDDVRATATIPTTTPAETLAATVAFFRQQRAAGLTLRALGVAAFGPIDLTPTSPTYGYITTTPKAGWQFTDVVGALRTAFGLPVGWDTDVNGAALGEYRWGAARGCQSAVYITVGTGIGGGGVVGGVPIHGLLHPEMGHLLVRRAAGDTFPGICPFHGDCMEGMACGPALQARLGYRAETAPPDHPVWENEAHYLAMGIKSIMDVLSPERIIVGGGVMAQERLYPLIRQKLVALHNGYLQVPAVLSGMKSYLVAPGLGSLAGMLGALELARLTES